MTETKQNDLLERLVQQNSETLQRLAEQQNQLLAQVNRQQEEILDLVRSSQPKPNKDFWDRLMAGAPVISALIIALTGAYFTYSYNQQQIRLNEVQTIEKFFPHLVGDEKSKRAAILAMSSLGNARLAAKVAAVFASEGTASALTSMAQTTKSAEDKQAIQDALYKTLDSLADKYTYENNYSDAVETYKKALALKEEVLGKDSPELAENLERLADLYEQHGDRSMAEEMQKRAIAVRKGAPSSQTQTAVAPTVAPQEDEKAPLILADDKKAVSPEHRAPEPVREDSHKTAEVHATAPLPGKAPEPLTVPHSQRPNVETVHAEEHEPRAYAHASVEQ